MGTWESPIEHENTCCCCCCCCGGGGCCCCGGGGGGGCCCCCCCCCGCGRGRGRRCCCSETKITLEKGINSQNSETRSKRILCKEHVEHVSSRCSSAVSSQKRVKRLLALPKKFLSFQSPTGSIKINVGCQDTITCYKFSFCFGIP